MPTTHTIRFPGEADTYRRAREELLDAELDLRRQVERVAALRRRLPLGGKVPQDYLFEEGGADIDDLEAVRTVRLSELFEPGKDTLILYSFMYGPKMAKACPMCTSLIDSFDGASRHVRQRANFAIVARSPIRRIREFARERLAAPAAVVVGKQQLQPRLPRRITRGKPTPGHDAVRATGWRDPSLLQH